MKYILTDEHQAQLPAWRDRWIANTHAPFEFIGGASDTPVVIEFRRQREHTPAASRRVED